MPFGWGGRDKLDDGKETNHGVHRWIGATARGAEQGGVSKRAMATIAPNAGIRIHITAGPPGLLHFTQ